MNRMNHGVTELVSDHFTVVRIEEEIQSLIKSTSKQKIINVNKFIMCQ